MPLALPALLLLLCLSRLSRSQSPSAAPAANHTRPVFLCGGDYNASNGYLASEGFPEHYPHSKTCTWTITVPEGQVVMLSFRVFDLEPDPKCRYDYLEVFNGNAALESQTLGRYCGTFRPGAILATHRQPAAAADGIRRRDRRQGLPGLVQCGAAPGGG
ncbi:hypothetical protein E2320_022485 [Naja naja]|nr:hypothetical protein E2320_022485 [Naja naja]